MLLTEEAKQDVYPAATLEGNLNTSTDAAYIEKNYYTIDPTYVVNKSAATGITDYQNNNGNPPYNNNPNSNTTANSAKLYQMNSGANKIGLSMSLKVMAGDTLNIFGKSYFYVSGSISGSSSAPPVIDLLTSFAGTAAMSGKGITGSDLNNITQLTTGLSNLLGTQGGQTSSVPKAYINWVFFDERFNYAGGGFDRVGSSGNVKPHNNTGIVVPKNGYVFVYCSNESPHNVFFDNLQVFHSRGPILEETHFYAFGLTMAGISSRAVSTIDNKYEYNGKEKQEGEFVDGTGLDWYDYGARMYDVQTGRWHVVDPMVADYFSWSPYSYVYNDPIKYIDPDGKQIWVYYNEELKDKNGNPKLKANGEVRTKKVAVQYKDGKFYDKKGKEFTGKNKFLDDVKMSLDYIQTEEADLNSYDNKRTVQELVKSDKKIFIEKRTTEASGSDYQSTGNILYFDPTGAKELFDRNDKLVGAQSAATELLHELGHAYMDIFFGVKEVPFDPRNIVEFRKKKLDAENKIINDFDNPGARKLGETPRSGWDQKYKYFVPISPISTEKKKE